MISGSRVLAQSAHDLPPRGATPAARGGATRLPLEAAGRDPVLSALRKMDPAARAAAEGHWSLTLANGDAFDTDVTWNETGWYVLACRPSPAAPECYWSLLELNGRLASGAKLVLDGRGLAIRAEVGTEEDVDVTGRVLDACHGLKEAWTRLHDTDDGGALCAPSFLPEGAAVDVAALCAEAGWPGTARDGGAVAVELAAPGFRQAHVAAEGPCVKAFVDLGRLGGGSPGVRAAVASLLLLTSGLVRLARAAIVDPSDGPHARFEVVLTGAVQAFELRHALEALSVACRLAAEEIRAIQDEGVARLWLTARGLPPEVTEPLA